METPQHYGNTPPPCRRSPPRRRILPLRNPWPVEVGATVRHVGNRFNFDDNLVIMEEYTVADAWVFVDIPKWDFIAVDNTRLTFRVRNLTDRIYAAWGDPGYPDQIILGAPRSYEVGARFKF